MATLQSLYDQALVVLKKHGFDLFIPVGMSPELINLLMQNHLDKVRAADSQQKAEKMMDDAMTAHIGLPIRVESHLREEADRKALYHVFAQWRTMLLKGEQELQEESGERNL